MLPEVPDYASDAILHNDVTLTLLDDHVLRSNTINVHVCSPHVGKIAWAAGGVG